MISAIIPVFNNAKTLPRILRVLSSCKQIAQVVVVDDGSDDGSREIMQAFQDRLGKGRRFEVVCHPCNQGKGAAIVRGLKKAKGNVVLFCDADLRNLKLEHINALITKFQRGNYDMVIAARESLKRWDQRVQAWVSGERILYKAALDLHLNLLTHSGNGVEQLINYLHRNGQVKIIVSKKIGHIRRFERSGLLASLSGYFFEACQLGLAQFIIWKLDIWDLWRAFGSNFRRF